MTKEVAAPQAARRENPPGLKADSAAGAGEVPFRAVLLNSIVGKNGIAAPLTARQSVCSQAKIRVVPRRLIVFVPMRFLENAGTKAFFCVIS